MQGRSVIKVIIAHFLLHICCNSNILLISGSAQGRILKSASSGRYRDRRSEVSRRYSRYLLLPIRAGAMPPATLQQTLRSSAQSGIIMCAADILTQFGLEKCYFSRQSNEQSSINDQGADNFYDPWRSARWAVAGLVLHGPYFYRGFHMLDKHIGVAKSFGTVVKKTAAAQLVLFPPYLVGLFSLMGVMEGKSQEEILHKVKTGVPKAFQTGCIYWPIANTINFAAVPQTMRVPFVASSAGVWNCYLSWLNSSRQNAK